MLQYTALVLYIRSYPALPSTNQRSWCTPSVPSSIAQTLALVYIVPVNNRQSNNAETTIINRLIDLEGFDHFFDYLN